MKKRTLIVFGILVALIFLSFYGLSLNTGRDFIDEPKDTVQGPTASTDKETEAFGLQPEIPMGRNRYSFLAVQMLAQTNPERAMFEAYHAPIDFWGKVVDQDGKPIEKAEILFGVKDHPEVDNPKVKDFSDSKGLFELTGRRGAGLFVKVSKEGYYELPASARSLEYYKRGDSNVRLPTKENPAVFVLQEKGEGADLIAPRSRYFNLDSAGKPTAIDLERGRVVGNIENSDLVVRCWVGEPGENGKQDWSYSIEVPKGGIQKRTYDFEFIAPEGGYGSTVSVDFDSEANNWRGSITEGYFIKLADGTYARVTVTVYGRESPNIDVRNIYINPIKGNKNLEQKGR
ncbi:MAG: hypothetical protein AAGK14_08930 [Verrucomicrobiota bacterium]